MTRLSMLIDTHTCIGCLSCTVACKVENGTPPGMWFAPVIDREVGNFPEVRRMYLPLLCMHCEDPACVRACPAGALRKRADGIVEVDHAKCCGSRACMVACPHGAIRFYEHPRYYYGEPTALEILKQGPMQSGTAYKCNLCAPRLDRGLKPACVDACPTDSRVFGDLDNPASEISKRIAQEETAPLRGGSFTRPGVRYTTRGVRAAGTDTASIGLPYRLQKIWDLPHALEFTLLGAGAGLYLASLWFGLNLTRFGLDLAAALALFLVGLAGLVLIADLGKPLRFWMALRNQETNWISRGAVADFIFMGTMALLALLPLGSFSPYPFLQGVLKGLGALSAILVATYPALAISSYKSVPAWFGPDLPLEFLAESLASGIALITLLTFGTNPQVLLAGMLVFALVRLGLASRRRAKLKGADPGLATAYESLTRGRAAAFNRWGAFGVGIGVTIVLSALGLAAGGWVASWLAALVALTTLFASLASKMVALRIGAVPAPENPRVAPGESYA